MESSKQFSQENLLFNPKPLTFLKLIKDTDEEIVSMPIRCYLSKQLLRLPLVNTKCTLFCYMSLEAFFNKFQKHQEYKCAKCNQTCHTTGVVYDPGYETVLMKAQVKKCATLQEIHLDPKGQLSKEKKVNINEKLRQGVDKLQIQTINQVRQSKDTSNLTIIVGMEEIRSTMNNFYKTFMSKIQTVNNFLFCRGKRPDKGGAQWVNGIYVSSEKECFHLNFCKQGSQIAINKECEIHFVPQKKAFFIMASQGKKLRLFKGSINNIVGDKLELEQTPFQKPARSFFGITHMYLFGGVEDSKDSRDVFQIDLQTFKVKTLPSMKEERAAVKGVFYNQKLYAIGGGKKNVAYTPIPHHQYFDFKKQTWTSFEAPFLGFNLGVFQSQNNTLAVYGGYEDGGKVKFINKYYLMDVNKFVVLAQGVLYNQDIKLCFQHQSASQGSSVLRQGEGVDTFFWKFTFKSKGSEVKKVRTSM